VRFAAWAHWRAWLLSGRQAATVKWCSRGGVQTPTQISHASRSDLILNQKGVADFPHRLKPYPTPSSQEMKERIYSTYMRSIHQTRNIATMAPAM
jgi:hypothetical protein